MLGRGVADRLATPSPESLCALQIVDLRQVHVSVAHLPEEVALEHDLPEMVLWSRDHHTPLPRWEHPIREDRHAVVPRVHHAYRGDLGEVLLGRGFLAAHLWRSRGSRSRGYRWSSRPSATPDRSSSPRRGRLDTVLLEHPGDRDRDVPGRPLPERHPDERGIEDEPIGLRYQGDVDVPSELARGPILPVSTPRAVLASGRTGPSCPSCGHARWRSLRPRRSRRCG